MKLRLKLALLCAMLCALALAACCALTLRFANRNSLQSAVENAVAEHHMLLSSLDNALANTSAPKQSESARNSLAKYVFRRFASHAFTGSQYILELDGTCLYNESGVDVKTLLETTQTETLEGEENTQSYAIVPLHGRRHVAVGSSLHRQGHEYGVCLLKDIEQVYADMALLAARIAMAGGMFLLCSALTLSYAVYRMLRPLAVLEAGAEAIAGGDYKRRLPVKGRDEIAALSGSFNAMAEAVEGRITQLRCLAESRRLLFGALSHELKTPMTAIIGYSEALLRTRLTEAQRAEAAVYIHAECTRLERLSEKLTALLTLETGAALPHIPTAVSDLFSSLEMTLQPLARREHIELTISWDDTAFPMDVDLMESLVLNLFDNARKAGARHIRLLCRAGTLVLEDDGCGIPAEALAHIAEPFYMVDKSRSRKAGGAGLGLALVERIAALHGGAMHIRSRVGEGSAVEITFR